MKKWIVGVDVGPINMAMVWLETATGFVIHSRVIHIFQKADQIKDYTHFLVQLSKPSSLTNISPMFGTDEVEAIIIENQAAMRKRPSMVKWPCVAMEFALLFHYSQLGYRVICQSPKSVKSHFNALDDNKQTKAKMERAAHSFFSANFEEWFDSVCPREDKPHISDAAGHARFYWEKNKKK